MPFSYRGGGVGVVSSLAPFSQEKFRRCTIERHAAQALTLASHWPYTCIALALHWPHTGSTLAKDTDSSFDVGGTDTERRNTATSHRQPDDVRDFLKEAREQAAQSSSPETAVKLRAALQVLDAAMDNAMVLDCLAAAEVLVRNMPPVAP